MYLAHSPLSKVLIGPRIPAPTDGWSYAGIIVLMFAATLLAALAVRGGRRHRGAQARATAAAQR